LFDAIWMVIGLVLLVEGGWILRAAAVDPGVIRFEAATLFLLGLWNTIGLYFEIQSGMKVPFGARIIFVGVLQLVSAYNTFKSYPHYKRIYDHLDRACLFELETKIGDMGKNKPVESSGLAEFKIDGKKCRAKFLPDLVIVFTGNDRQTLVAERSEAKVESTGNKMLSKALKVQLMLEDIKLTTEMKPECYASWQGWIADNAQPKNVTS